MAVATATALTVAAGAAVAGAAVGYDSYKSQKYYARKGAEEQQKAQDIAQKRNEFNAARERRRQIAQARVARGEVAAGVGAAGMGASSAGVMGLAASQQQMGENIGFLNQQLGFTQAIGERNQQAALFAQKGSQAAARGAMLQGIFGTVGSVAGTFAAASASAPPGLGGGGNTTG